MTPRQVRRAAERIKRKQERKAANGSVFAPRAAASPQIHAQPIEFSESTLQLAKQTNASAPAPAPVSASRLAANRANAQHSTGPRTPEGKAISARNNFRHGFNGAFTVLPWESQEQFDLLLGALRDEHQPSGITETILVDKMAQALWLTKRAAVLQHVTFNHQMPGCDDPKQLALYLRYETTHDRIFHKCLTQFLKLRAEKRKEQIGFESQSRRAADQTRRDSSENRKQELHRYAVSLAEAKLDHQELQNLSLRNLSAAVSAPKNYTRETQEPA